MMQVSKCYDKDQPFHFHNSDAFALISTYLKIVVYFAALLMFDRLKQKWKVGPLPLFLILCTFAIGGSLSGYAARLLLSLFNINNKICYTFIYIIAVTLIWPVMVLVVSILFGQFTFFKKYISRLLSRITGKTGIILALWAAAVN